MPVDFVPTNTFEVARCRQTVPRASGGSAGACSLRLKPARDGSATVHGSSTQTDGVARARAQFLPLRVPGCRLWSRAFCANGTMFLSEGPGRRRASPPALARLIRICCSLLIV